MKKSNLYDRVAKIVQILTPLTADERKRTIRASLALLGQDAKGVDGEAADEPSEVADMPSRAKVWIKQNGLSTDEVQQVFHISKDDVSVIADVPGKNKKEKALNCYLLTGLTKLLLAGAPTFDDKSAKALCESSGCHDRTNHARYLKDRGNEFTGAKDKGWTLTSPGLKRAAQLVKEASAAK